MRLSGAQTFLGNLAGLMNTHSKRAFEVGKVAAMSQAAVSGALAVMDAWKSGMSTGGPWAPLVAVAYAAAAAANAVNLINNIRKQTFGGGGGAPISPSQGSSGISPVGLGGGTPQQPAPSSQTLVNVNITGVVTQSVADQIIEEIRDAIGTRDAIIIPQNSRQAADLMPA